MLMWMTFGSGGEVPYPLVHAIPALTLVITLLIINKQNIDVRVSEDAGRYLCDFIYYSSLAHLWKHNEERRVVFLHVPVDSDAKAIATGVEALEELIRAVVVSGQMKKLREAKGLEI